ncbi:hypothetical protein [Pseudoalteromonas sp. PPB1]|uniref:hypothetical protein n=1 Tax=Pseudoalteromonas sp. PPB1 TaxID=2756136 RepID=UPI0018910B7F|nr:hypothetical protein [Pseudoalteromonas sp. PPB1]
MKKLILSVALALTSLGAQANTCSSIGCTSVIETLYTSENGNIYVGFRPMKSWQTARRKVVFTLP